LERLYKIKSASLAEGAFLLGMRGDRSFGDTVLLERRSSNQRRIVLDASLHKASAAWLISSSLLSNYQRQKSCWVRFFTKTSG
jgi:hypothetical protein